MDKVYKIQCALLSSLVPALPCLGDVNFKVIVSRLKFVSTAAQPTAHQGRGACNTTWIQIVRPAYQGC